MRKPIQFQTAAIALALAVAAFAQAPTARVPASYKDLKFPPLHQLKIPPVVKRTLSNGITLFLVEDHELPLVSADALIRVGDRYEPMDKAGLAAITLSVMRTGGTPTRSGDALDQELDRIAASVETSAGTNSSSASMFVLKEDTDEGLTILADILQHPAFPEDKIELAKLDLRDSIARRNDDPGEIFGRELGRLVYGKNSPYERQPEYATLANISRDDLVAFHKQYFQPENVILGISGDFNAAEMQAKVEKTLGAWPRGGNPKPGVPAVDADAPKAGLYLINKEDVNQSTVGVSMLLGQLKDPDYEALVVMTYVLGGGFGSRLTDTIRTREGLAYSAGASYSPGYDHPGPWTASASTKSGSTIRALELIRQEITRVRESEVTDDELARAKDSILKGEAFDFDSTGKIVSRLMVYEYYGYPSDFLEQYRAAINKVTKADVLRVAKKYLDVSAMKTLVLGNTGEFDRPLSSLGMVTPIDITIPPPPNGPAQ